ncbi:MAG: mercury(II) reductase [Rhodospirillales bacterium]|nr:mercury(II) reductase [Rhodospirillales bacterium]
MDNRQNDNRRESFDLAVIGAGSAGFSTAIKASELGARVIIIGFGTIGGTCVNVGCVPSKTMIRAAETLYQGRETSRFNGISGNIKLNDWSKVVAQKDALVSELREAKYTSLLPSYENISYREGKARLVEGGVDVDGEFIRAGKIVVATGSAPSVPNIAGLDDVSYLTSTTAQELDQLPKSLIVIGAGYIGCELAQMFSRMGTEVTLVCRRRILPEAEPEISEALAGYLSDEGVTVVEGASYESVAKLGDGVQLSITKDNKSLVLQSEHLLMTTGRKPNTGDLGLNNVGVEVRENGGIVVNDQMQTTNPNIYAAGDVTGRDMFVYMAAYGAKIAADNALNGCCSTRTYDATTMPSVVFTDPQVASVGLTETSARNQGIDVDTSVLPLSAVPRYIAARDTRGVIKLVAEKDSGRLIGAHILAPEGSDSIQTAVMAIKAGMTVDDLGDMIFPYLTGVEGLKLAAQTFNKDVAKLSCCA